jgi:hypothetical protein
VLQCANPACRKALASPREAQTVEFEIVSVSVPASDEEPSTWDESPKREAKRVYLCPDCADSVSITFGPEGVQISPAQTPSK